MTLDPEIALFHGHHPACPYTIEGDWDACRCGSAAPAEERGVDVERLLTAMASVEFKATGLPMDVSMTAKARKVAQEYAALTDGLVHDPTYADAVWDAARQSGDPR